MELMLASQLHSISRSFLADRALRLQSCDLLQLFVLLIRHGSPLVFLPTEVDEPDEGNWAHGEEGRHDERHRPDEADGDDSPFLLAIRLLLDWLLWLGLCGDGEGDILRGVVLIAHLLNGLRAAVLTLDSPVGEGDLRAVEAPELHVFASFL